MTAAALDAEIQHQLAHQPGPQRLRPAEVTAGPEEVALGLLLRARREALELSTEAVARRVGSSWHTINRIERGHMSATLWTLLRLADALGCSIVIEPGLVVRLTVVG